jgi:hypothetical protein
LWLFVEDAPNKKCFGKRIQGVQHGLDIDLVHWVPRIEG